MWFVLSPNTPNGHKTGRMIFVKDAERGRSILGRFVMFWKHSESKKKAFGKETFEINIREVFALFWSIRKPYWKHLESKREAFGETLGKIHLGGRSGSFQKIHHFRIRKANGKAVWSRHYGIQLFAVCIFIGVLFTPIMLLIINNHSFILIVLVVALSMTLKYNRMTVLCKIIDVKLRTYYIWDIYI